MRRGLCRLFVVFYVFFFFQAEDGIRDAQESRGLGDVYKRQDYSDGGCNDFRTEPDPSEYSGFSYGYMNGPLGFTWGINWAKW